VVNQSYFFTKTALTMKNICTFLLAFVITNSLSAQLLSEDFSYSTKLTANGWVTISGTGTNDLTAGATGLVKAGYANSGVGNALDMAASGEDAKRDFTAAATTGGVYGSFLMTVKTVGRGKSSYVCGFTSGAAGTNYNLRFYIGRDSLAGDNFKLGLGRGTTVAVFDTIKYNFNTTYLVTLKYAYNAAATLNDTVAFQIHPANQTLTTEPTRYTFNNLGVGTGSDATELNAFYLRQGTASDSITLTIDGIRVDKTWLGSVTKVSSVKNADQTGFKTYPSVTSSFVNLEWDKNLVGTADLRVVNLLGQTVLTQKVHLTDGNARLDLSRLANGAYIVQLHSDKGVLTSQVEKQ
jgi:Secretion system C-terminal sorting domain